MEIIKIDGQFLSKRPLSYSALKQFRKSPKHYQMYIQQPKEMTDAMLFGTVVECMVLEPENFDKKFKVYVKPNLRTNDGKTENERLMKEAFEKGITLIGEGLNDSAKKAATSLMDHEVSRRLIEARKGIQVKLKWLHKATGIPMIGYVDFESTAWESNFIVDLKTARTSDPDDFIKDAAKLDYHIQAGAYMDGYPRCKFIFPNMAFLVVENDEPYNVSVMFCEGKYLEAAANEYHGSMNAFKYCMDNDQWNMGYDFRLMGVKDYFGMRLPAYVQPKFETVLPEINNVPA